MTAHGQPPSHLAQCAWLTAQIKMRHRWLTEGIRSGHGEEAMARYAEELPILSAILQTLRQEQGSLFSAGKGQP